MDRVAALRTSSAGMNPRTTRGKAKNLERVVVGPVTRSSRSRGRILILGPQCAQSGHIEPGTLGVVATDDNCASGVGGDAPTIAGVKCLDELLEGDLVALHPGGRFEVLYRVNSLDNALFVTNQCNSRCVMCSQPPTTSDDINYRFDINTQLAALIPKATVTLGLTGGEPTLLGNKLPDLMSLLCAELPDTQLHILSNGRALAWTDVASGVAAAATDRVVFGVPLYSHVAAQHDNIVRARHAFSQTVLGLHNLASYSVRVEIRTVLHKLTAPHLLQLAKFIHRYLPFAEHVAFMGLEHVGYAVRESESLWMEPPEFALALEDAVGYLADFRFNVSLYNLQPCTLPRSLWPFCRQSISDWKRRFLPVCSSCGLRATCGGVFGTSTRHTASITPVST